MSRHLESPFQTIISKGTSFYVKEIPWKKAVVETMHTKKNCKEALGFRKTDQKLKGQLELLWWYFIPCT